MCLVADLLIPSHAVFPWRQSVLFAIFVTIIKFCFQIKSKKYVCNIRYNIAEMKRAL